MSLLGTGALAMWWDVPLGIRREFEHWHSHEHFPERMSIPGFLRGSRWTDASGRGGFFVLYELDSYDVLTSAPYLERLNHPTPWSIKMMPHHHNMVRSQCRVLESSGGGVARCIVSIRLSAEDGQTEPLRSRLREVVGRLPTQPGLGGAHLLSTETPDIALTTEQRIRGSDSVADWILLVSGYDIRALQDVTEHSLNAAGLVAAGARPGAVTGLYEISFAFTREDRHAERPHHTV